MKKLVQLTGHAACFIAVFAMLGGHWLVLQSVAWSRMLTEYSHQDSLATAVCKTFDGRHPCPLCRQIQAGRQQEERQEKIPALLKQEKMPDLILADRPKVPGLVPLEIADAVATVPRPHPDFIETPPTPPPRGGRAAL